MNRIIFFFITFVTIFQTAFAEYSFFANAPTGQRIFYKIIGNNVTVCCPGNDINHPGPWEGYTKPTGSLTIPSNVTYNGTIYTVTEIGYRAFETCVGLASVIIPNTVTSVHSRAFYECTNLTSVNIGNSVHDINMSSFEYCSNLTSLVIPNSVVYIGHSAFESCDALSSLTLGNAVESIENSAFRDCTSLASIYIPSSVQSIASNAFQSCSGLISIAVSSNNSYYDSRNSCNAIIRTSTNDLIVGCKNTVIPNTVTSIGPYAFYGCSGLESIISHAAVAPSISGFWFDAFTGVSSTIPVFIPCGSAASYASEWSYFPYRIEVPELSLIVTSDNNTMGFTQILSGPNCSDSMATILATAYTCYRFAYWSDGSTDNPRQITVTQDTELTAYFDIDTFSVIVKSSDSTRGSVEGGGEFVCPSSCTIEAIANNGYHFHHWSTGAWSNPFTFLVTHNTTLIAYFEADSGTEVEEITLDNISLHTRGNRIVIEGTTDEVRVFDMTGRNVRNEELPAGVYLVKVGDYLTRKVVVIR